MEREEVEGVGMSGGGGGCPALFPGARRVNRADRQLDGQLGHAWVSCRPVTGTRCMT